MFTRLVLLLRNPAPYFHAFIAFILARFIYLFLLRMNSRVLSIPDSLLAQKIDKSQYSQK